MDRTTAKHLSHLQVEPTIAEDVGAKVAAAVGANVVAAVGDATVGGAPAWSGQHPIARQHGNIQATSFGTKQHTDCISFMQFAVHVFISVQSPL